MKQYVKFKITHQVEIKTKLSELRCFLHNIRAIMAKIRSLKKSNRMVIVLTNVRRSYGDFSSQADFSREN